ncbi:MAG: phage terminase large subunit [Ignisphaera sp.]|nr:phage terminase large subunit [Ignisphaera sp.]
MDQFTDKELKLLLNDFKVFLDYVFECIGLPAPTPLQLRLAEILGKGNKRLILEAARGTGKSWVTAVYVVWRLLRDIEEKILVVSANSDKAKEIASFIRRLLDEVPLLAHMDPSNTSRDSIMAFDVLGCKIAIAPSVAVTGIAGQLTGKRASLILADDIEVPKNSLTELMRDKLLAQAREFEALLIPDKPSNIIYLGTPQSQESIYNKLDKTDADVMSQYVTYILPAEVPADESVYDGKLDPWIMLQGPVGTPTDKIRFSKTILDERKAGYGLSGYKLQYMLDTSLSDQEKFPLKFKDLMCLPMDNIEGPATLTYSGARDCRILELANIGFSGDGFQRPLRTSQEYIKYQAKIMAVDPSGTGTDETAYAILGLLNGYLHLIDVGGTHQEGIREGYGDKALLFLAKKAKEHQVDTIVLEKNFGAGMFTKLFESVLTKVYPCSIEEVTSKGQKEVRMITSIEPLTSNHKLIINYDLVEKELKEALSNPENVPYTFLYQYSHLTKDKRCLGHDDRVDAVAMACAHLRESVGVDAEDLLEAYREEQLQKFLDDKIFNNTVYKKPGSCFIKKR